MHRMLSKKPFQNAGHEVSAHPQQHRQGCGVLGGDLQVVEGRQRHCSRGRAGRGPGGSRQKVPIVAHLLVSHGSNVLGEHSKHSVHSVPHLPAAGVCRPLASGAPAAAPCPSAPPSSASSRLRFPSTPWASAAPCPWLRASSPPLLACRQEPAAPRPLQPIQHFTAHSHDKQDGKGW